MDIGGHGVDMRWTLVDIGWTCGGHWWTLGGHAVDIGGHAVDMRWTLVDMLKSAARSAQELMNAHILDG